MKRYVFNIMDQTGHTPREFTEDQKTEASALFAKLVGEGRFAYANVGGEQRMLTAFDDTVEQTTFHRQLQGG